MLDKETSDSQQVEFPERASDALYRYLTSDLRIHRTTMFIYDLCIETEGEKKARDLKILEYLREYPDANIGISLEQLENRVREGPGIISKLEKSEATISRMVLSSHVDNFLTYISDFLALVFLNVPEALKSNDKVSIEYVLEFDSFNDIVEALAEKRVNELSYLSVSDLNEFFINKLGFSLFESEEALMNIVRLVELRNIISHNRAIMNKRAKKRFAGFEEQPGEEVCITIITCSEAIQTLAPLAIEIDQRGSEKFHIPQPYTKADLFDFINKL